MHILFANFDSDPASATSLGNKLIDLNINLNLIDNNGLSPLHVAIKKNQIVALKYAMKHNINGSPITRFDFNKKAKKGFTALHYSIIKSNADSFMFLLNEKLSNVFTLDEIFRTPRGVSVINSPYYKILFRLERL